VVSKATATHLRHVQRVRRVRLNIREQREWLKWRGLRRGEREADGSEHWVCCASDEIKGSGAGEREKAALLDELTFVLEAIGSERLAFLLKSHDREDAKVLGAEAT
jgi:hypothetical protein